MRGLSIAASLYCTTAAVLISLLTNVSRRRVLQGTVGRHTLCHVQTKLLVLAFSIDQLFKLPHHIMRKQGNCLGKVLIQGTMPGRRRRERSCMVWIRTNNNNCAGEPKNNNNKSAQSNLGTGPRRRRLPGGGCHEGSKISSLCTVFLKDMCRA